MNRRKHHEILQPLAREMNDLLRVFPRNKMLADIVKSIDDDDLIIKYLMLRYRNTLREMISFERKRLEKHRDQHLEKLIDECIRNSNIDLDKSDDM